MNEIIIETDAATPGGERTILTTKSDGGVLLAQELFRVGKWVDSQMPWRLKLSPSAVDNLTDILIEHRCQMRQVKRESEEVSADHATCRNLLANELTKIDGGAPVALVDCVSRAAELLSDLARSGMSNTSRSIAPRDVADPTGDDIELYQWWANQDSAEALAESSIKVQADSPLFVSVARSAGNRDLVVTAAMASRQQRRQVTKIEVMVETVPWLEDRAAADVAKPESKSIDFSPLVDAAKAALTGCDCGREQHPHARATACWEHEQQLRDEGRPNKPTRSAGPPSCITPGIWDLQMKDGATVRAMVYVIEGKTPRWTPDTIVRKGVTTDDWSNVVGATPVIGPSYDVTGPPLSDITAGIYDLEMADGRKVRAEVGVMPGVGPWWAQLPRESAWAEDDWSEVVGAVLVHPKEPIEPISAPRKAEMAAELLRAAGNTDRAGSVFLQAARGASKAFLGVVLPPVAAALDEQEPPRLSPADLDFVCNILARTGATSMEDCVRIIGRQLERWRTAVDGLGTVGPGIAGRAEENRLTAARDAAIIELFELVAP